MPARLNRTDRSSLLARYMIDRPLLDFIGDHHLATESSPDGTIRMLSRYDLPKGLDSQSLEEQLVAWTNHDTIGLEGILDWEIEQNKLIIISSAPQPSSCHIESQWNLEKKLAQLLKLASWLENLHKQGILHAGLCLSSCHFSEDNSFTALPPFIKLEIFQAWLDGEDDLPLKVLRQLPPEAIGYGHMSRGETLDVYGFGLVAYELLSGQHPIAGTDIASTVANIYGSSAPALCDQNPKISINLSQIIARCLRKPPTARYQSLSGLCADLRRCAEQLEDNEARSFALGKYDSYRELNLNIKTQGRELEIAKLQTGLESASPQKPSLLVLGAPSGRGKTRLANDCIDHAKALGRSVFRCRHTKYDKVIPLGGLKRIFLDHAESLKKDAALCQSWQQTVVDKLGPHVGLLQGRLTAYAGLWPAVRKGPQRSVEEEEHLFVKTAAQFITILQSDMPYMVFLDDIQWCDQLTIQILGELATLASSETSASPAAELAGCFLLAAYRSEEVSEENSVFKNFINRVGAEAIISLPPLDTEASQRLIALLLDEPCPPTNLSEYICGFSQGNPFQIYELLRGMLRHRAYQMDSSGKWHFDQDEAAKTTVSDGVHHLIGLRIADLSNFAQAVLGNLALIGSSVDRRGVSAAVKAAEEQRIMIQPHGSSSMGTLNYQSVSLSLESTTDAVLTELAQSELAVVELGQMRFLHDRIREAAWNLLSKNEAKILHRRYGESLAIHFAADPLAADPRSLFEAAFHLAEADDGLQVDLAHKVLMYAGQRSIEMFAYKQAAAFLSRARQILETKREAAPIATKALVEKEIRPKLVQTIELLADALALSEQVKEAIILYEEILLLVEEKPHRSEIYSKISSNNLYLFRYVESINAGGQGLQELDEPFVSTKSEAIIALLLLLPKALYHLICKYVLRLPAREMSAAETTRLKLRTAVVLPSYFVSPIPGLTNMLVTLVRLIPYSGNEFQAILMSYVGAALAALGFMKLSEKCFDRSSRWYAQEPMPVSEMLNDFIRAYCLEFPRGNLDRAYALQERAIFVATELGETFWRFLAFQGMIHIDIYGGDYDVSREMSSKLEEFRALIGFEPTPVNCTLRSLYNQGEQEALAVAMDVTKEVGERIHLSGFETIDVIYSMLARGEIYLIQGDINEALPCFQKAFLMIRRQLHRTAYCALAPALYAHALALNGEPKRAIFPLAFAWLNVLLGVRIFQPQTLIATANCLAALKLRFFARAAFRAAIRFSTKRGWRPIAAECKHHYGQFLMKSHPQRAAWHIRDALEFYREKAWPLYIAACEKDLETCERKLETLISPGARHKQRPSKKRTLFRKRLEVHALLEMSLKLSKLGSPAEVRQTVLETMCRYAGADHGVLFLPTKAGFKGSCSLGVDIDKITSESYLEAGIDIDFLRQEGQSSNDAPVLRPVQHGDLQAGVLLVPVHHGDRLIAVLYLGNQYSRELFTQIDEKELHAMTTQASLTLHNLELLSQRETAVRISAEFELAKSIQSSLLVTSPVPQYIDIQGYYAPAEKIGGDWYGYHFDEASDFLFIFMGDVTGHGVASAMITAVASGSVFSSPALRSEIQTEPSSTLTIEERLLALARAADQSVSEFGHSTNRGMTMCIAALNCTTGQLSWISAGHPQPYVLSKARPKVLLNTGSMLGGYDDSKQRFKVKKHQLKPDDSLIFYTDGLLENCGPTGRVLRPKCLIKQLHGEDSAKGYLDRVLKIGQEIWQGEAAEDDLSLLIVKWQGPTTRR